MERLVSNQREAKDRAIWTERIRQHRTYLNEYSATLDQKKRQNQFINQSI